VGDFVEHEAHGSQAEDHTDKAGDVQGSPFRLIWGTFSDPARAGFMSSIGWVRA
jgi:hypothetical protein